MLLDEEAVTWLLGGLCDVFNVSFDRSTLLTAAELPYTEQKLFHVGARLGFHFEVAVLPDGKSRTLALPCVLFLKGTAGAANWASPALVMGEDDRHLVYFLQGVSTPSMVDMNRVGEVFGPFMVRVQHGSPPTDRVTGTTP